MKIYSGTRAPQVGHCFSFEWINRFHSTPATSASETHPATKPAANDAKLKAIIPPL